MTLQRRAVCRGSLWWVAVAAQKASRRRPSSAGHPTAPKKLVISFLLQNKQQIPDIYFNFVGALKWLLVSHTLVFRGRTKGRGKSRKYRDNVRSRFVLWAEGDMRGLLSRMMSAAARAPAASSGKMSEDDKLKRAMALLSQGQLSRCRG